jgi:NSS family neurotransmitter:Na+ symporter
MHEIGTAFFTEELKLPRKYSAWIITIVAAVICLLCSWSLGTINIKIMGLSLMDFCDQLTANLMLPLGGVLVCLFVGWYIPRQVVHDEFTNGGQQNTAFYQVFLFAVRYICPLCILLIFLHQLGIL